jgi:UMF1 family MFS transporter
VRFLLARVLYNDGLVTIFSFGGIYAAGTFGFTFNEVMYFGIALNVAAGLGAFLFGFLDDMIGGKNTIQLSNLGLIIACLLAVFTTSVTVFWVAGILIGLCAGPNQASSRSLMSRFTPKEKQNEFFGFFAFSGKATAFIGPLMLGILTKEFGSQRYGIAIVVVLVLAGAYILHGLDEKEASKASVISE